MQNFQGLIKNKVEFPGMTKKILVEFPVVLVFGLKISEGCNIIFQDWSLFCLFCLEFLQGYIQKKIPKNSAFFLKTVCPPPLFVFFWNSLMRKKRGGFSPDPGVLLSGESVTQYRCMNLPKPDENDNTFENDENTLP